MAAFCEGMEKQGGTRLVRFVVGCMQLSSFLGFGYKVGYLPVNVGGTGLPREAEKLSERILSESEILQLIG